MAKYQFSKLRSGVRFSLPAKITQKIIALNIAIVYTINRSTKRERSNETVLGRCNNRFRDICGGF